MSERNSYSEALIANGASVSGEVDLRNHILLGIEMPSGWTAASIAFQSVIRNDGAANPAALTETFVPVVDEAGAEVTVTAAASKYITLSQALQQRLRALGRVKVVSGTNAAPVAQGAARTLRLIVDQRR